MLLYGYGEARDSFMVWILLWNVRDDKIGTGRCWLQGKKNNNWAFARWVCAVYEIHYPRICRMPAFLPLKDITEGHYTKNLFLQISMENKSCSITVNLVKQLTIANVPDLIKMVQSFLDARNKKKIKKNLRKLFESQLLLRCKFINYYKYQRAHLIVCSQLSILIRSFMWIISYPWNISIVHLRLAFRELFSNIKYKFVDFLCVCLWKLSHAYINHHYFVSRFTKKCWCWCTFINKRKLVVY